MSLWGCFKGPSESGDLQLLGLHVFPAVHLLSPWTGQAQVIWAEVLLSQQVVFCGRRNERLPPYVSPGQGEIDAGQAAVEKGHSGTGEKELDK